MSSSFLAKNCLTIQIFSGIDLVQNLPEIYLTLAIFIGLIIVGAANFIPAAHLVAQKKEITFSLYDFVRTSIMIAFCLYLMQIFIFLKTPTITFNGHSIVDSYTQVLKLVILATT